MSEVTVLNMIDLAPVDPFLAAVNLLHAIVFLSIVLSVDSPFKKPVVKLHHFFLKRVADYVCLIKLATNLSLLVIAVYYAMNSWQGEVDANVLRAAVAVYSLFSALVLQKASDNLAAIGTDRLVEIEQEVERANIIRFQPPSKKLLKTLLAPQDAVFRSDWTGLDNVPKDVPALYVMNHSLYGLEMASFLGRLYLEKDVFVRGLADHFHFCSPHGSLMKAFGAVDGTRSNVDCLMENNSNILVYPGGGQEVLKHSSVPKYALLWKERLGFARLAIKHGYPIIPCASVGTEEMVEILADISLEYLRKGQFLPIPGPMGPYKLQKLYFWVGEPIPTVEYEGDWKNEDFAREVRDKTKDAVEDGIKLLQKKQQNDPDRFLMKAAAKTIGKIFSRQTSDHVPSLKKVN